MRYILFFITVNLFLSCSTSKNLYYWGNYEHTFYQTVNKPGDETKEKHIEEIKSIIEKANQNNIKYKVGPGVYAELGYYMLSKGNREEAERYFAKEISLFPESSTVTKFISK
jgi:hypothetical protein